MMTPEQVQLVRLSFTKIMAVKMDAARCFYDRLFAIAPEVRPMFSNDIESQARKLMDTLAIAIGSLRDPSLLNRVLDGLAARHVGYGVRDEHYTKVGEALIWTLEKSLGDDFTPQVKSAWTSLYAAIATQMRGAARPKAASA
jgi:nitric oxide dioxygenase